jgi:Cof subfamily protein (haloacid dehalogenase superfamily)
MGYKLLVTDLDGTLAGHDHGVSPRTIKACRTLEAKGCAVTFATGRTWHGTVGLAREIGLQSPLIAYQGALARQAEGQGPLWHDTVPLDAAREILGWLGGKGARISACTADLMLLENPSERTLAFLDATGVNYRQVGRLADALDESPTRLALYGDPDEALVWEQDLQAAFPSGLRIGRSIQHLVEITHLRASKGQAITRLAEWLGISLDEVVACGDNYNDADMITTAGLGVAMSHAPAEILATAGRIVDCDAVDGMADFLEEIAAHVG